MRFGYARVSTQDQNLDLQKDELLKWGCNQILEEKLSGKNRDRPELEKLIEMLREGDFIIVWKLDRLGRSLKDLIEIVGEIQNKGANFISTQDGINTQSATGRFTFNIFASLAEFEREIIRERTLAGLTAARARGRMGGRPKGISFKQMRLAQSALLLYENGDKNVKEIGEQLGLSRATCYRYIELAKDQKQKAGRGIL